MYHMFMLLFIKYLDLLATMLIYTAAYRFLQIAYWVAGQACQ